MSVFPIVYIKDLSSQQTWWHLLKTPYLESKQFIKTACGETYHLDTAIPWYEIIRYLDTERPQTFVNPDELCPTCFNLHIRAVALRALIRGNFGKRK